MEFDKNIADKYGVKEAIVINSFKIWIEKDKANNQSLYNAVDNIERTWTRNSFKAMEKLFPFWTTKQIQRIINSLVENGVLITHCLPINQMDRVLSYAFKNEKEFIDL